MKAFLRFLLMFFIVVALVLWWSPDLRHRASDLLGETGLGASGDTLYKWQDKQGVWQYTQDPPPKGVAYRKIEVHPNVNVLPKPPKPAE